ncbi:MAG: glycosyltransferase family 4 protein [Candidatus Rokubacteria bacterium]|nr:glycosyltransferase family 4 protein [Candidatus Rokubacteria bacterium]MBI3456127.1 glycosyltransferase family 4 protein [Candidatus Rokubacteria bacterium]
MKETGVPVRVARVIARLNVGGPAQHVVTLCARLPSARYESVLLTGREGPREGSMADLATQAGVRLVPVPGLGREVAPLGDARALVFLYRFFRRFRPDIVHTHTAKAGALGRVAARLAGVPVVAHTYHGHVLHSYFSRPATWLFATIERALARISTCLFTVSESVKDELARCRIGRPGQLVVVPLGLDLRQLLEAEAWRGSLRAELGLPPGAPLIGVVARLVPIKRHEQFLRAAALVRPRSPGCHFLIVGDGERGAELEKLARREGLADCLHFLGWRRDLDRIYADLDVVALTSANEGSPVSLIEAMAAGCPVVATRVGGVPDLVEEGVNGLLVRPGDPAALADALVDLLEDPERRRRFGANGRKRVYPAYGAERLVADVDRLYTELLERRGDGNAR